ncbi:hypothetical protein LTR84_010929 [Exophiala bonariae]|uniref:Regulator of volume decrease after cellular swelling-domain-containing protein n=1 Tax=Exophiala bonariae TaxID=1690606 RepID=A0AAV9NJB5_9EURO|nr:hypothetical protein LTR84_010929 [Exophiala bonariae]
MEILREAPKLSSFVPLVEHQSATPVSFHSGPPVLHYYSDRSKVIVLEQELESAPAFAPLFAAASAHQEENGTQTNGNDSAQHRQKVVEDVDIWVTSDKLFVYSNAANAGVSIPYRTISLHAIQTLPTPAAIEQQGVYMQLITSTDDSMGEDLEPESLSVTIVPTASAAPAVASEHDPAEAKPEQTPVQAMFNALSNCSNLHPDPVEDEESGDGSHLIQAGLAFPGTTDGGLPPAMPGSGGWITAENMHEFVDEDGNWIEGQDEEEEHDGENENENETLGAGAGNVRPRDDAEDKEDDDETKWRRTS